MTTETKRINDVATDFILQGIQEWGQSKEARVKAVQDVLDAAGFDATATCSPVFGGIWPTPCEGKDAAAATAWLKDTTLTMPRGKVEYEVAHVAAAIAKATSNP